MNNLFITFSKISNKMKNSELKIYNCNNDQCDCKLTRDQINVFKCNKNLIDEIFTEAEEMYLNNFQFKTYSACILNTLISFSFTRYQNRMHFITYIINNTKSLELNKSQSVFIEFIELYLIYLQFIVKLQDNCKVERVNIENDFNVKSTLTTFLIKSNKFKNKFSNFTFFIELLQKMNVYSALAANLESYDEFLLRVVKCEFEIVEMLYQNLMNEAELISKQVNCF